ncbi:Gfo/Idh/MocA family oxidoreductase [Salipaludibacillus agaradhaerens]|uniref:Gfo/Idh/MocA family oxidoreductase n=1 Tax=Salipaludibacillus agaradhaerens TaxID=76935 RepID=A0A9Q4G180_SALAG|nr:Gfo/Idh/MocA family oxidoreductase [Salipaludibacillus agaradhaerens]MCR6098762.1 Gfo/Idh/MocA family oxidoreductase [Salipaludibacillus agaradhaerens]MCR6115769.1 Gfo/Idh/MocA family oxidoreductase [Salipaludibacillus agaradhaerens]
MRLGIIGLGDIAQKAYLPVLAEKEGIEVVLCTRNPETLNALSKKYRFDETAHTVDELITKNIDAAIVSTATDAHVETAEKLLANGIHTYIDKPISTVLSETEKVAKLAKESGVIAMVGFNRRFIPKVKELKQHGKANMIMIQKNRFSSPDFVRRFILDDFVHVVDTLRFLMDTEVKEVKVDFQKDGEMLNNLIIQLIGDNCHAIGIMNRNGAVNEEIIEYTTGHHKYVVNSLVETTHYHNKNINISKFGDWEPTLYKRGFYNIVDYFIDCVTNNRQPDPSIEDSLFTHEICESIVKAIDESL